MDYLNVESVKMVYNAPQGASEFVVNDDIRIIIMPISFDHTCEYDAKLELI